MLEDNPNRKMPGIMATLTQNRTVLITTHCLPTTEPADAIVMMRHSRFAETGEHAEPLERNNVGAGMRPNIPLVDSEKAR